QIVLTTPAGRFSETVACLSDAPSGLPASAERQLPDGTYRFRSEVLRLRSDEFARQVATVRELAGHGWALVGQFPGEPDALTALAFTSTQAPSLVAQQVRGAWKPANDYADATGVYLRYARDAVTIFPLATGSLIMVEESSRAYRRYYSTVGSSWGYTAGRGES